MITRRALTATGLYAAAFPALAGAKRPLVIAHRGASGERPEHTLAAYRLGIEQGADFIEPDLVPTRDGHLVARHENEIGDTTDVAGRPEFAGRRTTKSIDGKSVTGWFTEDFTLAELKTLRACERLPKLRPASARYDGQETIPTFEEVLALAKAEGRRLGRPIGVCPEMKHPTYFAGLGLGLEPRLAAAVRRARGVEVVVQCFEIGSLKRLHGMARVRTVQLVSAKDAPPDRAALRPSDMVAPKGLKEIATYAEAVGVEWPLIVPVVDGGLGPPTPLVAEAHAVGLKVYAWTVRAENTFLPPSLRRGSAAGGHGDAERLLKALYAAGVDGVFSDFPAVAVAARS